MITRRRFLQLTVALAVAAPLAKLSLMPPTEATALSLAQRAIWTPTPEEVHEWLQYYKTSLKVGHMKFQDAIGGIFNAQGFAPDPAEVSVSPDEFLEAERAFHALEGDRYRVGRAHATGYDTGRYGGERRNDHYTGPSNEGFSWYNGWLVGYNDKHGRITPA